MVHEKLNEIHLYRMDFAVRDASKVDMVSVFIHRIGIHK